MFLNPLEQVIPCTENEILERLAAAGYLIPLQASNGSLYVPPVVENIARLLAAGYLLKQEYGAVTEDVEKNGDDKIEQAYNMLDDILSQKIVLIDVIGQTIEGTAQVTGWPDDTTATVGTDGTPQPFAVRMSKRF